MLQKKNSLTTESCEYKEESEACKIINTMDYLLIAVNVIQLKSEEGI